MGYNQPQRSRRDSGQALVEFALGLVVLLLLIFAVIEGGRLLHGWITLQNAAREGGRYAITGQYDESCLSATPACPDARVWSIKESALRASTGLAINPRAGYEDANYHRVEISGVDKDNVWQTDYAGEAGKPVMVRVVYRLPVVTPLLRPIAKSVRLVGQVVMNNENYAQVNETRSDIDLSKLSPPPPAAEPVADLQISKSVAQIVALVNEPIAYTLRVSNNGPDEARGIVVVDELPVDVTLLSVSPADTCNQAASTLTCEPPNLPRGASYDITVLVRTPEEPPPPPGDMINLVSVSGAEMDDDMTNNSDAASTLVVLSASVVDLEVVANDDSPDPVVINQELSYTILVRNNGVADATGVELTDQLPEGMMYETATVSRGSGCNESDGTVVCQLGDIAIGETATARIDVVAPSDPGTLINRANVIGDQVDPDERNNSNAEVTTISPEWSDVYVTMDDLPDPTLAGSEITYSIVVGNNGPSDASAAVVVDSLPPDVELESMTTSQGDCSEANQTIVCELGTMDRFQEVTIKVVVSPAREGTFTNQVVVSTSQTDPNPINDSAATVTTVEPAADLSLTKSASPSSPPGARAGELLTYRLVVSNEGPSAATNVYLEDEFPVDASFLGVTTTQGTCRKQDSIIACNVGNLASGNSVIVSIEAIPEQEGVLVNRATVTASQSDTNRSNNSAQDTTTVNAAVNAFVTLNPVCGKPATRILISGFNWPSEGNKDVTLYWDAVDRGNLIGTIDNNGSTWETELVAPVNAIQGSHTVIAERQGVTASAVFSVPCPAPNLFPTQPLLVNPGPVAVGDPVTFQVDITNNGDLETVNQFFVGLYFDPPLPQGSPITHVPQNHRTELVAISWLSVGESRTLSITAENGFDAPGSHVVHIVADSDPGPAGVVEELSETDNVSPPLLVEVEGGPLATPTPGPTPSSTPEPTESGSLIGQAFLAPFGGQPLPQAGVEVKVYDASAGMLDGFSFTDGDGSYFLSGLNAGTKTVSACIIIDEIQYTYTVTGVDIQPGEITFKDLYLDVGLCN